MVRAVPRWYSVLLVLTGVLIGPVSQSNSWAQEEVRPPGGRSEAPEVILDEETEAALAELTEAGADSGSLAWARPDPARGRASATQNETMRAGPASGLAWLRLDHGADSGASLSAKVDMNYRWLSWRARLRRPADQPGQIVQTLELRSRYLRLHLGSLGIVHGFGLLVGRPGRSAALAVGQSLALGAAGLRSWTGSADPRVLRGLAVGWKLGAWSGTVATGQMTGGPDTGERPYWVQVAHEREPLRLTVLMAGQGENHGLSLAGDWRHGPWRLGWEAAAWRRGGIYPSRGAWQVFGSWHGGPKLKVALVLAGTDARDGPQLGTRPAALSGGNGSGWAVRLRGRNGSGLSCEAVIGRARHGEGIGGHRRVSRTLLDLQTVAHFNPGLEGQVRFRRSDFVDTLFSERYPWQAATEMVQTVRSVLSVRLRSEIQDWILSLLVRTAGFDGGRKGRRSLLSVGGAGPSAGRLRLRLEWVTAWGADVDLVSAVNPVTAYVLPRHWGRWRSETMLGCELDWVGCRIQAAFSVRRPDPADDTAERPVVHIWTRLAGRW